MAKYEYVCRFCVFLIVVYANVNDSQLLTSCASPLDNEICKLICTTTDHTKNVAFYKLPHTTTVIAQCIPTVACGATGQYNITQPDPESTVLSFVHSIEKLGTWRCTYGSNNVNVSVFFGSFPKNVYTTLTSNTTIDTSMDVNATLECLYSEPDPTVTLQYEAASGKIVTSAETFQCLATVDSCADMNFTTYACAVVIRAEAGIDYSYSYSIKLKTNVGNVEREDVKTIATGITFKSPPITTEQQTTTDETTTKKTNEGPKYNLIIIIGAPLGACALIGIFCLVIKRRNKRDTKTPKKEIANETL